MATREELMVALRNADAAGDVEAARRIAAMVASTKSEVPVAAPAKALPKASKSLTQQAAEATLAEMPWYEKTLVGAGKSVADVARTVGLMPDADAGEKQIDKSLTDTGAGMVGQGLGEVAMTAVPGAAAFKVARAMPVIRSAGPILQNIAGGAAAGGAGNAVMGNDVVEGAGLGAVLGPVGHVVGNLAGRGVRAAQDVFGGTAGAATKRLKAFLGDRADAAVTALRNTRGMVPGEMPTAGRAASANLPELKALEEAAMRSPGAHNLMTQREANSAARAQVLDDIAQPSRPRGVATQGGQVPMSQAEWERLAKAGPFYDAANPDRVIINPRLQAVLDGEEAAAAARSGNRAFSQEQTNAFAGGQPVPQGATPRTTPNLRRDTLTNQFIEEAPTTQLQTRSIQDLQKFKDELTGKIKRIQMTDPEEAFRLSQARAQLTEEMRRQSPHYAQATDDYRVFSQPQNQGEVADTMVRALRDPTGRENVGAFLGAMDNAPRTIKRAGGDPRFTQLEQVMTPEQMARINGLRGSAQREAAYQNLDVNSGVVDKYKSVFDQLADNTPGVFNQMFTIARAAAKRIGARSDTQVNNLIGDAIRDPNRLAALIEAVPPQERNAFVNAVRQLGSSDAFRGGSLGAVVPSMTQKKEQ